MSYDQWKTKAPEGEDSPDPVDRIVAKADEICSIAAISSLSEIARRHPDLAEKAEAAKKYFR